MNDPMKMLILSFTIISREPIHEYVWTEIWISYELTHWYLSSISIEQLWSQSNVNSSRELVFQLKLEVVTFISPFIHIEIKHKY